MIDSLKNFFKKNNLLMNSIKILTYRYFHRPENVDNKNTLKEIINELKNWCKIIEFYFNSSENKKN